MGLFGAFKNQTGGGSNLSQFGFGQSQQGGLPPLRASGAPSSSRDVGFPDRFQLDSVIPAVTQSPLGRATGFTGFVDDLSQKGVEGFGALFGTLPARVAETPFSVADTALKRGGINVGESPFGTALGVAGEAVNRIGNFIPALINARDASIFKAIGDLPDDTRMTDDLLRQAMGLGGGLFAPSFGESAGGGLFGIGSHVKTVREFKAELAKRRFFQNEDGTPISPEERLAQLRGGKSAYDFGYASVNDNPLVDMATRMLADPTNALFLVPGGAMAKLGLKGAEGIKGIETAGRVLPRVRLVEAGAVAARLPRPIMAAEAIAKGDMSMGTLKGLGELLKGGTQSLGRLSAATVKQAANPLNYIRAEEGATGVAKLVSRGRSFQKSSLALGATNIAINRLTGLVNDSLGGNVPVLNWINDFTKDVENDRPLSENSAWMLASAVAFPYGEIVGGAAKKVGAEKVRLLGRNEYDDLVRAAGSHEQLLTKLGGDEGLQNLLYFADKQFVRRKLGDDVIKNMVGAESIPDAAMRIKVEEQMLQDLVQQYRVGHKINGKDRIRELKDWAANQGGFEKKSIDFNPTFDDIISRWNQFAPVQQFIGPKLRDYGDVISGLRGGEADLHPVLLTEQVDAALTRLEASAVNGIVPRDAISRVLSDNPQINSLDRLGYWEKSLLPDAKPVTIRRVRSVLKRQRAESVSIKDHFADVIQGERAAPPDLPDPATVFEPRARKIDRLRAELNDVAAGADRIAGLKAELESLGVSPDVIGDQSGFFTAAEPSHAEFYAGTERNATQGQVYYTNPPMRPLDLADDVAVAALADVERKLIQKLEDDFDAGRTDKIVPGALTRAVNRLEKASDPSLRDSALRDFALTYGKYLDRPGFDTSFFNQIVKDAGYDAVLTFETNPATKKPARVVIFTDTPNLHPVVGSGKTAAELAQEGKLFHGSALDPRHVARAVEIQKQLDQAIAPENLDKAHRIQRELEDALAEENNIAWVQRGEAEQQAGVDPTVSRRLQAEASAALGAPEEFPATMDAHSPEMKAWMRQLDYEVAQIDPSYTVTYAPTKRVIAALRPDDPDFIQAVDTRTALGDWLHHDGIFSKASAFYDALFGPNRQSDRGRASRQALYNELVPLGAKPKQVDALLGKLGDIVKASEFPILGQRVELYRGIHAVPASKFLEAARESLPERVFNQVGEKGVLQRFDRASSSFYRAAHEGARAGNKFSQVLERFYQGQQNLPGAGARRLIGRTVYPLFRFMLDPRWLLLNSVEAQFLGAGSDGILRANGPISRGAQRMLAEGKKIEDMRVVPDAGWMFGKRYAQYVAKSWEKRSLDTVESALNQIGQQAPELVMLRQAIRREADQQLASGLIDEATHKKQINASNREIGEYINDFLYRTEKRGVKGAVDKTIDEAADEWLTREEREVMAPLLGKVAERNVELWQDVKHMYTGNPDRSTIERVMNSYWLYWPISYQIKATKWLANIMLNGSFGHDNGALLAGKYALWQQEHNKRMKDDPGYAAMFKQNPTLWFMAQMLLPITPDDIGVSLSRATRFAGASAQDAINEWTGSRIGLFTAYKQAQDGVIPALTWITDLGPFYTQDLLNRIGREPAFQALPFINGSNKSSGGVAPLSLPSAPSTLPLQASPGNI